jgi:hypothetical protein
LTRNRRRKVIQNQKKRRKKSRRNCQSNENILCHIEAESFVLDQKSRTACWNPFNHHRRITLETRMILPVSIDC